MKDLTLPTLLPCPFCGAGETQMRENGRVWGGKGYGEPSSVSVVHWCVKVDGQPSRVLERVGRDKHSAIEAWNTRAALSSHHEDGGRAATPGVARKQLLVDVFFQQEGDEPFICAVHGKATVKVLEEIECELVANDGDLYGKGDGIYRMECSRFPGQYGFEGRCEIAPGWEFDEVSFEPEDAPVLDDGVALGGEKGEAVAWMWQHEETGQVGFIDPWQKESGWEQANPRAKLIRPLFAAPVGAEWQPIETAPKDGTKILVLEGGEVMECRWYVEAGWCIATFNGQVWTKRKPSLWMHKPPPPVSGQSEVSP